MPPYTYTTFEEIEAKEWASNTVNTILTDISPVSFESDCYFYNPQQHKKDTTQMIDETRRKMDNPVRRSFSFLEGSLFSPNNVIEKDQKNARRSQSTILPAAPSINKLLPQPSISSRIRGQKKDRTAARMTYKTDLLDECRRKRSNKAQRGIVVWKNTFTSYLVTPPPYLLDVKTKPYTKRSIQISKFITAELLTTEETYLDHLLTIKNFYMDPLLEATSTDQKKSPELIVNQKDIEIIFAHIPELIALSSSLVERLHDATAYLNAESAPSDASIGKVFCDLESYFDVYIAYTVNFSKSKKHLSKASSSIVYRQLVQDTMRKKETNRMLLSDYMIAPIQRITRYCLLLKDLLKYSHSSNPDYIYLEKTLKCLSALAFAMNTVE